MIGVPKPPKSKSSGVVAPKLTEEDFIEISEKIAESMEYKSQVEISVFFRKRMETVVGVITSADSQTGILSLYTNRESVKININNIVRIK